ncbi:MAG: acyltransferase [Oscillospiraceae bacterium]|nr:acyltransferase [Oscillospiraceae bacterium]
MAASLAEKRSARVIQYEWFRLFATAFVVLGHSAYWVINTANGGVYFGADEFSWIAPAYFSNFFDAARTAANGVYRFHMAAFFFLSGAVLRLRPIGAAGPFLLKKARRLLVPYYLCGLLWMLPVKYLAGFYKTHALPAALGNFLLGGSDSGHLWFLPVLFLCMALFALLETLCSSCEARKGIAFVPLLAGLLLRYATPQLQSFLLQQFALYFFWFSLGWAVEPLRAAVARWEEQNNKNLLMPVAVGFAALSALWKLPLAGFVAAAVGCAWCMLLGALCTRLFPKAGQTALFSALSRQTFCVYLLHDPLEHLLLRVCMQNRVLATAAGCWAYLLLRTVGVFALCVAAGELWRRQRLVKNKK